MRVPGKAIGDERPLTESDIKLDADHSYGLYVAVPVIGAKNIG